ncbi:MAG TPA: Fic family protein [Candidatus Rubrimentiphilum sp.]|nr:Fic family protein [Candidatus Rubrimentiphilum sp.]
MAKVIKKYWTPQVDGTSLPHRDRRGCHYAAYEPDPLREREFTFFSKEAADVADAERQIVRLNERARALADTEALARLLLRAESVASSRIEGLEVGPGRLLRADAAEMLGEDRRDVTATEILGNIQAMTFVLEKMKKNKKITVEMLLETHRLLLASTSIADHGGKIRTAQNWIGGSSYNPCSAEFVPPPPEMVKKLLSDLCDFSNEDSLSPVAQAAIAHAQFETIHPFADGNGRVGRSLIHMIFRRRELTTTVSLPVSLVLATLSKDYIRGLSATRYLGSPASKQATNGINLWVGIFAVACRRAVADASAYEDKITELQDKWRKRLGTVRANSALELLLAKLPGSPIVTANTAANLIRRSDEAANQAIARLTEAKILVPLRMGQKRNRVFEARDVITEFTNLERRLASPVGNTKIARPVRSVPYRRDR